MSVFRPAECRTGDDALARGAWDEARRAFEQALATRESPEALEGLGLAGWWLDLADVVFDAREKAYRLYRDRDDRVGAARIAVWLAWDTWAFRGEFAVASGWLLRARRLLECLGDVPERAWLELREGALALLDDGDPDRDSCSSASTPCIVTWRTFSTSSASRPAPPQSRKPRAAASSPENRNPEPRTWNVEPGTWNLEPGTWNPEPGTQNQVARSGHFEE
jgi:hypothetical protein